MIHLFINSEKLPTSFDACRLLQSDQLEIIRIDLKAGEVIPTHQNSVDVIFLVLGGTGQITIEEDNFEVGLNDLIEIPKEMQRSISNTSEQIFSVLVLKKMSQ